MQIILTPDVSVPDSAALSDASERPRGTEWAGRHLRQHAFFWMTLLLFGLTIFYINPFREVVWDDDFAYARTVRHLLETGTYQLDNWASANMLFQAYWGALFAAIRGYSLSSLRISTLVLGLFGLFGFYGLAREHGLSHQHAGMLTLGLLASPLFVWFSFTFMTDIPFLTLLILALLFYTRAMRLSNYPLMLLASVFAAGAILTRQLGVALIAGVFFIWVLDRGRWQRVRFYLSGLVFPIFAALWLTYSLYTETNWGAKYFSSAESGYLAQTGTVLVNLVSRPGSILQYLALFALPFASVALIAFVIELDPTRPWLSVLFVAGLILTPVLLIEARVALEHKRWLFLGLAAIGLVLVTGWRLLSLNPSVGVKGSILNRNTVRRNITLVLLFAVYVAVCLVQGHSANEQSWFLPSLPWNFRQLAEWPDWLRATLTILTTVGAVLFARIFALRYINVGGWKRLASSELLLDLVTFFMLVLELIFFQIGDEYFLVFLPFVLIVVGLHLKDWLNRNRRAIYVACLLALIVSAMWTRDQIARSEAIWQGAESVRESGVEPNRILGLWTWNSYYGLFEDYLTSIHYDPRTDISEYFKSAVWHMNTSYLITDPRKPAEMGGWQLVREVPYLDSMFREQKVQVWHRVTEP
jgi:hypothetical protein